MSWIDTAVVVIIIVTALFIFYRALREPLDMLFGLIGKGFRAIVDKIQDSRGGSGGNYVETIKYG